MINKDYVCKLGLEFIDEYSFDDTHHSFVFKHNNICVIVDDNICKNDKGIVFDYSKYCEMQNKYMATFDKLYRFNFIDDNTYNKISEWLNKSPNDIEIKDVGGALLNEKGKLIGITTFRTKDNSGNVIYGIVYCIPINIVLDYIK